MPRYFNHSPWTDAANAGSGLANTLMESLKNIPMLRWQLIQEQRRADQQQAYQQQQQEFDRRRQTETERHDRATEDSTRNRFIGSQEAREKAMKEKISEFDAAQQLKRDEDDQKADDRAKARADAKAKAEADQAFKDKSLAKSTQQDADLLALRKQGMNQPKLMPDPSGKGLGFDAVTPGGFTPIPSTQPPAPESHFFMDMLKRAAGQPTPAPTTPTGPPGFSATNMHPMTPGVPRGTNAPPAGPPAQPPVPMSAAPQSAPVAAPQPPVGVPSAPVAAPAPQVSAPPPAAAPAMVRVRHPNGQTGTIPASALQQAVQQGYTPIQ